MNVEQMRYILKQQYSGPHWLNKVLKMPDNQVIAVYNRMLHKGQLKGKIR